MGREAQFLGWSSTRLWGHTALKDEGRWDPAFSSSLFVSKQFRKITRAGSKNFNCSSERNAGT